MVKPVAKPAPAPKMPAPDDTVEPAARVLRRFRLVFNAVKTHFQQVEKKAGIGGAQLWALSIVQQQPGIGMGDLAKAMDVHQSTASNLVKGLATKGLLTTARSEHDRRTVALHLLPAARSVLRKAPGPMTGVLPEALARMDPASLARLDEDLARLIAILDADARAANIPLGQ